MCLVTMEKSSREKIAVLIGAGVDVPIRKIVGCSERTVYNVTLDHEVGGMIEASACAPPPPENVTEVKASADREWAVKPEDFIKKSCGRSLARIEAMLAADGGGAF